MVRSHLKTIAILGISAGLILLTSCGNTKKTTSSSASSEKPKAKVVSTTNLLKSAGKSGVQMFTLSDLDSKALSRENERQLDALAREIKAMGNCQVTVIGHADNTGTSEANEAVSKKRAKLVADYLKKKGVANITTTGESYNHPVAGNDTAAGRAKNRRVEVFVSTVGKYDPYK